MTTTNTIINQHILGAMDPLDAGSSHHFISFKLQHIKLYGMSVGSGSPTLTVVATRVLGRGSNNEYDSYKEEWTQYVECLSNFFAANSIVEPERKQAV